MTLMNLKRSLAACSSHSLHAGNGPSTVKNIKLTTYVDEFSITLTGPNTTELELAPVF